MPGDGLKEKPLPPMFRSGLEAQAFAAARVLDTGGLFERSERAQLEAGWNCSLPDPLHAPEAYEAAVQAKQIEEAEDRLQAELADLAGQSYARTTPWDGAAAELAWVIARASARFPAVMIEDWLPERYRREAPRLVVPIARAGDDYIDTVSTLRGGCDAIGAAPSDLAQTLAGMAKAAKALAAGFDALADAAMRRGQTNTAYGQAVRQLLRDIATFLFVRLLPRYRTDTERRELAAILQRMLPEVLVGHEEYLGIVNNPSIALLALAKRLHDPKRPEGTFAERAEGIPHAQPPPPEARRRLHRELALIWIAATKHRPGVRNENRSPFHTFVAGFYGHLAGTFVRTDLERTARLTPYAIDEELQKVGLDRVPSQSTLGQDVRGIWDESPPPVA